jgi:hypothetical protein
MTFRLFNLIVRFECGELSIGPIDYSRPGGPTFYSSFVRLRLWHG